MTWYYGDLAVQSHDDLDSDTTDIVYCIIYTTGQRYIGKKAVRSIRKKPPLKGYKRPRRVLTNLPFVNYEGSCEDTEDMTIWSKEILYQCSSRKTATYIETALLFHTGAIFRSDYLNSNIGGKFFDNDLKGLRAAVQEDFKRKYCGGAINVP